MSIALLMQNGDLVCRMFMRSSKLQALRCVTTNRFDIAIRLDLLTRAPLEALRTLGLTEEAGALARESMDWVWLTRSELIRAIDAEATTLGVF